MALLTIADLSKTFTRDGMGVAGLRRLDLEVERGELVSLLGPSGCGKTTTLRCIAGLETPDRGRVELEGTVLFSSDSLSGRRRVLVPPERRGIGMVFQDYALWPHMDVFNNVAFGLRGSGRTRAEVIAGVELALRSVRLWDQRDKSVSQLSGGQQQRVAVARALAPKPAIILFDEPLSNLDSQLRNDLRLEILELQRTMGLTAIWVTHDQEEALGMSSRIVLLNDGVVEQIGTPPELWRAPATGFAAGFLGSTQRVSGTVIRANDGSSLLLAAVGAPPLQLPESTQLHPGDQASAYLRLGAVRLSDGATAGTPNVWRAKILTQSYHGDYTILTVQIDDIRLKVRSEHLLEPRPDFIDVCLDPADILAFRD